MNQTKVFNFPFDDARKLSESAHRDFCIQIIGQMAAFFLRTMKGEIAVFSSKSMASKGEFKVYSSCIGLLDELPETLKKAYDSDAYELFFDSNSCLITINFDPIFFSVSLR